MAMPACSSTSRETYTETKVLVYPKGSTPYLKDMEKPTYIGANNPTMIVNHGDDDSVEESTVSVSDVAVKNPPEEKTLSQINYENSLLLAKQYNRLLQSRQ